MSSILLVLLGCLIGWNLPQPAFARVIQSKLVDIMIRVLDTLRTK